MTVTSVHAVATVAELRELLAHIPGDTATGPYVVEFSPSDGRLDVHPVEAVDPEEGPA